MCGEVAMANHSLDEVAEWATVAGSGEQAGGWAVKWGCGWVP